MKFFGMFLCGVLGFLVFVLLVAVILLGFGFRCGMVQSSSMVPSINVGDIIIWACGAEIECGDVVVYRENGRLIAHRVVEVSGKWLVVRGDSERSGLSVISEIDLYGKVVKWCSELKLIEILLVGAIAGGLIMAIIYLFVRKECRGQNGGEICNK